MLTYHHHHHHHLALQPFVGFRLLSQVSPSSSTLSRLLPLLSAFFRSSMTSSCHLGEKTLKTNPGPPGWGLDIGPATQFRKEKKNKFCYEISNGIMSMVIKYYQLKKSCMEYTIPQEDTAFQHIIFYTQRHYDIQIVNFIEKFGKSK